MLPICEGQMVRFMLCITDWIMRAKIGLEFSDKFLIVLHPQGIKVGDVCHILNSTRIPELFLSHFRMIPESFLSTPEYSQVFPSFLS